MSTYTENPIINAINDEVAEHPENHQAIQEKWLNCLYDTDETTVDQFGDNAVDRAIEWADPADWERFKDEAEEFLLHDGLTEA